MHAARYAWRRVAGVTSLLVGLTLGCSSAAPAVADSVATTSVLGPNGALPGSADFEVGSRGAAEVMSALGDNATSSMARYEGVSDTAALRGGRIVGSVEATRVITGDVIVMPTHDHGACKPFTETIVPSAGRGIGNAVVWLAGVTRGMQAATPQRAVLTLDRCQLEPRVQRVSLGSTMQVKSRDAMLSRLRFVGIGGIGEPRAEVNFNDAGQIVPSSAVAAAPGVVEVRDYMHPWVRAFVVVAPHPYVAVTTANGEFRFDAVPPGTYTLVVWQEALGVRTRAVRITSGVESRIVVAFP